MLDESLVPLLLIFSRETLSIRTSSKITFVDPLVPFRMRSAASIRCCYGISADPHSTLQLHGVTNVASPAHTKSLVVFQTRPYKSKTLRAAILAFLEQKMKLKRYFTMSAAARKAHQYPRTRVRRARLAEQV